METLVRQFDSEAPPNGIDQWIDQGFGEVSVERPSI